jgi:hypothetical protein
VQQGDPGRRDGDQDGVAGVQAVAQERSRPAHELVLIGVNEGIVLKTGGTTVHRIRGAVDQHVLRLVPKRSSGLVRRVVRRRTDGQGR